MERVAQTQADTPSDNRDPLDGYSIEVSTPVAKGNTRRSFLRAALGAVAMSSPALSMAKVFTEEQMDKEDDMIVKALDRKQETAEPSIDSENGTKPSEIQIQTFIKYIADRSEGRGAHIQQHENAMWLIAYFKFKNETDPRVLYYPAKKGKDSAFVASMMNGKDVTKTKFDRVTINKSGSTDIYIKDGENIKYTNKERAIEAVIDVGTAYCIIPKGTPIIETTVNGQKIALLGECRNPIKKILSECPPVQN